MTGLGQRSIVLVFLHGVRAGGAGAEG